jgi:hypothetical protein
MDKDVLQTLQEVTKTLQQRKVSFFSSARVNQNWIESEVHPEAASETSPSKLTVEEAKAAQERSPALRTIKRVLRVLASVSKMLDSALEGTPLATPIKVINGLIEVAEARHTCSSTYMSPTHTRYLLQHVGDINETAGTTLLDFEQREEMISEALKQTQHPQSREKIEALARCV